MDPNEYELGEVNYNSVKNSLSIIKKRAGMINIAF